MLARVYIALHERAEAAEAWGDRLSPEQLEHLLSDESDFWLNINGESIELLAIEDEG